MSCCYLIKTELLKLTFAKTVSDWRSVKILTGWWINKHNQNYNNIFEHDWLSPVRFEHYQDSVRVMLVIEQCAGTI